MTRVRRLVAPLQTWWLRSFLVAIPLVTVVPVPWWGHWTVLVALIGLSTVRPPRRDDARPVAVRAPVRGRWAALNSPGTSVPSHGVRAYGQAFAVDIAHPRADDAAGAVGWGLRQRRAEEYTSFGEPVTAVAAGTVVAVTSGLRDHRARSTWPGIAFMLTVEGFVREIDGARFVVGNHVVIDHGDGVFSLSAHLRRGSATVRPGDTVPSGARLGEVGNSGNTSEPHLHVQLMDHPRPTAAAGLPFRWTDIRQDPGDADPTWARGPVSTDIVDGLPANGQVFTAGAD
ncbi:M23 family metallopeptidase [Phycicoccus sp. BSK3Z-2]|uniref:M23 family metallopeptidase n=1 Tax=Phycicoccus avicenniae TaxID=2828860 RepID=A0A941HZY7_9MICO|nr:M23 family metallopeptidase [Phycicoccus avicenniae]MBR7744608.1 M23 family metallopeptidase [Phycicoccus avicenniae]